MCAAYELCTYGIIVWSAASIQNGARWIGVSIHTKILLPKRTLNICIEIYNCYTTNEYTHTLDRCHFGHRFSTQYTRAWNQLLQYAQSTSLDSALEILCCAILYSKIETIKSLAQTWHRISIAIVVCMCVLLTEHPCRNIECVNAYLCVFMRMRAMSVKLC